MTKFQIPALTKHWEGNGKPPSLTGAEKLLRQHQPSVKRMVQLIIIYIENKDNHLQLNFMYNWDYQVDFHEKKQMAIKT